MVCSAVRLPPIFVTQHVLPFFFSYHWERLCVFNGSAHIINHISNECVWNHTFLFFEHIYTMSRICMGISFIRSPTWGTRTHSAHFLSLWFVCHTIYVSCITAALNVRITNEISGLAFIADILMLLDSKYAKINSKNHFLIFHCSADPVFIDYIVFINETDPSVELHTIIKITTIATSWIVSKSWLRTNDGAIKTVCIGNRWHA